MIDQLIQRDPHIRGGGIQHEHQPRQPRRGGRVELQLGVRHLWLVPHRRPVPGAQTPTYTSQPRTRSSHTCATGRPSAGKSAISTITRPAAETARSASATYDPFSGKFRSSEVCDKTPASRSHHPDHPSQPHASLPSGPVPAIKSLTGASSPLSDSAASCTHQMGSQILDHPKYVSIDRAFRRK